MRTSPLTSDRTFIGAIVSNFTSCQSMHAWFTVGQCFCSVRVWTLETDQCVGACDTHRDAVAEIASLYYAFAVDALSDIMSMY